MTHRRRLDNPGIRDKLIREFAQGRTISELAVVYGTAPSTMSKFRDRWRAEIDSVAAGHAGEFDGLWIADKRARLTVLEGQADRLIELFEERSGGPAPDDTSGTDTEDVVRLSKELRSLMRTVAEELGQMPARLKVQIDAPVLNVRIEGIDLDAV